MVLFEHLIGFRILEPSVIPDSQSYRNWYSLWLIISSSTILEFLFGRTKLVISL